MKEQRIAHRFALVFGNQYPGVGGVAKQGFFKGLCGGNHLVTELFVFRQLANEGEDQRTVGDVSVHVSEIRVAR